MKPLLKETRVDCLKDMMGGCLTLVYQEDMYTNEGRSAVASFAWDIISELAELDARYYWINRITDAMYARNPSLHRDYYLLYVMDGVRKIRLAKGLPV